MQCILYVILVLYYNFLLCGLGEGHGIFLPAEYANHSSVFGGEDITAFLAHLKGKKTLDCKCAKEMKFSIKLKMESIQSMSYRSKKSSTHFSIIVNDLYTWYLFKKYSICISLKNFENWLFESHLVEHRRIIIVCGLVKANLIIHSKVPIAMVFFC